MNQNQIQSLANGIASILLSHAAHGLATLGLTGMGEITLRDGLVVAAAAAGARTRQAWIMEREVLPQGWRDAEVDLVISRRGNQQNVRQVGGVELKWWRRADPGNAANRRRDLIKDFIRAAALYPLVEDFSFVALLSTAGSWSRTARTTGTDRPAMRMLASQGSQNWNVRDMSTCSAVKGAVRALNTRVPIPNIFHTELLSTLLLARPPNRFFVFSRVWAVRKPQNTRMLDETDIAEVLR